MFMLIMQFFWKYIDDLMGKGLEISVIIELLFYVSASLIPLALPLAMLLSSIMTFGNLAENNELTALKSAGLSLYRIMKPLTILVIGISIATFFFSNYVIPVANLKWRSLIYDIQETKIASILSPGKYTNELDGYSIKIEKGGESSFENIIIHDHTQPNITKTIRAVSGEVFKSENGNFLFFNLKDGIVVEELTEIGLDAISPAKISNATYPSRRTTFKSATYKIDLTGFKLNRSDEDLFKNSHEMLNVFQISTAVDSIQKQSTSFQRNFINAIKYDHPYFQSVQMLDKQKKMGTQMDTSNAVQQTFTIDQISNRDKMNAIRIAMSKARAKNQLITTQADFIDNHQYNIGKYYIEFHRKFALSAAILVLFFIGAPLGAIVRKGGFGAPVVIAALLFMIYFVLISVGDSLASEQVLSPFMGMWIATFILLPVAILLMRSAANDSKVFDKEAWASAWKWMKTKFKKRKSAEIQSS